MAARNDRCKDQRKDSAQYQKQVAAQAASRLIAKMPGILSHGRNKQEARNKKGESGSLIWATRHLGMVPSALQNLQTIHIIHTCMISRTKSHKYPVRTTVLQTRLRMQKPR
jgi:hypothetical protein